MKAQIAAVAAVAAVHAYAESISYTTVTYDDCSSAPMETMITVTDGVTVTWCPECENMTNKPSQPGHTTVYTTTYMSLCPTGMVPATYTVTESCTEPTPTWTPGPSHIPQGFTVTTKMCDVCDKTPTPVTITEPCGCEAHEGTPMPNPNPAPTSPAGSSPPGRYPPGNSPPGSNGTPPSLGGGSTPPESCNGEDCGGSSTGGGSPPPESCNGEDCGGSATGGSTPPESCNGEDCGGSATGGAPPVGPGSPGGSQPSSPASPPGGKNPGSPGSSPGSGAGAPPYPTPTTMGENCPGPQCRAVATGGSMPPSGNTTGITPVAKASSLGSPALLSSTIVAIIIAALAFSL